MFRTGGARPPTQVMVAFIDDHRRDYGVEPICVMLPIAPSTYYAHKAAERDPELRSNRVKRDEGVSWVGSLAGNLTQVHMLSIYGY